VRLNQFEVQFIYEHRQKEQREITNLEKLLTKL
jgi:hypothetical protein